MVSLSPLVMLNIPSFAYCCLRLPNKYIETLLMSTTFNFVFGTTVIYMNGAVI